MAASEDHLPNLCIFFTFPMPAVTLTAPVVPSLEEAKNCYYGLSSQPLFIARFSATSWVIPTGMKAYIPLMQLRPISTHSVCHV